MLRLSPPIQRTHGEVPLTKKVVVLHEGRTIIKKCHLNHLSTYLYHRIIQNNMAEVSGKLTGETVLKSEKNGAVSNI
ncbi:hypothetical protein COS81_01420 [candidate division WWE3 bacterium CG06_land_8_20_14_3_00_42_16]|uniref:Uncharacterized protein n=2 Tax=Katanobacteria TaxID=422282 RepID=A0A2M7AP08_UNCKA|nr:MAG: hypothetical protein COS81_01420 [candidate division WWE3 bacterium CG06_land_8_20_14_3_00_42_16]PJC69156.1 MAG: hypothetical protein CO015_01360 [candidate division WWE3 bacterium CG_4_8_14_3_um_filter_42_11]